MKRAGANRLKLHDNGPRREACAPRVKTGRRTRSAFRLRRILVPVDLTARSSAVVEYAALLAGPARARITLFHVLDSGCSRGAPKTAVERFSEIQLLARVQKHLGALAERAIRGRAGYETLVRCGIPHVEIDTVARQQRVDLIILATHGERGLPDFCFGSTAEDVLRHAPCPVLVLPRREIDLSESKVQTSKKKGIS